MNIRFYGKHIDKDIKNPEFISKMKGFQESYIRQDSNHMQSYNLDEKNTNR